MRHLRPLGRHISDHFQKKFGELDQNFEVEAEPAQPETIFDELTSEVNGNEIARLFDD